MKDKLRDRKERRKHKSADLLGLTEQEKQDLLAAEEIEAAADAMLIDSAILSAVLDFDEDEKKRLVSSIVRENSQMSEEEKMEAVEKFLADAEEMEEKYRNQQEYSSSVLSAKLAARKRMRDAKLKEESLKKELDLMSAKQVQLFLLLFLSFLLDLVFSLIVC